MKINTLRSLKASVVNISDWTVIEFLCNSECPGRGRHCHVLLSWAIHCCISFSGLKYSRNKLFKAKVVTMFSWFVRNPTAISRVCITKFWLSRWMSWYLGFMDRGSWVHHYLFLNYNNDLVMTSMAFRTLPVAHLIQTWCVLFWFDCKSEYGISLCASFDGDVNSICSIVREQALLS